MEFTCSVLCELPFMLNLPNGAYTVVVEGAPFDLEILQEQIALHFGQRHFAVGDPVWLREQFGERFNQCYQQPLRTILRHRFSKIIEPSGLPAVDDDAVLEDLQAAIIGESPLAYAGNAPGLQQEANQRWTAMTPDQQANLRLRSAKRRYAKRLVPDKEQFLAAVNSLIRLYMQRFNDFFVEEVAVHQLASQAPLMGIYVQVESEGELVDHHGIVERFPPIMRRPWLNHPQDQVDRFKQDLKSGIPPDSVALLGVRARSFFQRGAYRSAIIEASAALDLAISRKIRAGYRKKGKTDADIDSLLRQPSNQRFDERAKALLKDAVGKSAAEFDNTLWSNVVNHRTTFRQGVTHADAEPPKKDSEQIMEDFLRLAGLVDGIAV